MTRPPGDHLSPDEIDSCLSGAPALEVQQHLDRCQACLEQVRSEREIAELIAGLPLMAPAEGFADRVMASSNRSPSPASATAAGTAYPCRGLSGCHAIVSMRWRWRSRKAP